MRADLSREKRAAGWIPADVFFRGPYLNVGKLVTAIKWRTK
jgi:hypothetical protein